jgi:pimeloyl-ACP methyl ester carboxylesterase
LQRRSRSDDAPDAGARTEGPGSAGPFPFQLGATPVVTAVTLLVVFFGAVAAYVAWAAQAVASGVAPGWLVAGAIAIYVAIYVASAAFSFALAWIYRTPRPPQYRIGAIAALRLYACEAAAMAKLHPRMAFGWWAMRDPPARPAQAPVLLVHGVLCNAGAWLGVLPRLAAACDNPVYTLSYSPPQASIEVFAEQLAAKIDAIREATGAETVTLVAHSMGGLVARAYLRRHGPQRVRGVVTIGTPHHGSVHAWLFPGVCFDEMRPGSAWLAELNRNEAAGPPVRIVALWSWHDSMVAPQASATLEGADNVGLTGIGHNSLVEHPAVIARIVDELRGAEREAQAERGAR